MFMYYAYHTGYPLSKLKIIQFPVTRDDALLVYFIAAVTTKADPDALVHVREDRSYFQYSHP